MDMTASIAQPTIGHVANLHRSSAGCEEVHMTSGEGRGRGGRHGCHRRSRDSGLHALHGGRGGGRGSHFVREDGSSPSGHGGLRRYHRGERGPSHVKGDVAATATTTGTAVETVPVTSEGAAESGDREDRVYGHRRGGRGHHHERHGQHRSRHGAGEAAQATTSDVPASGVPTLSAEG